MKRESPSHFRRPEEHLLQRLRARRAWRIGVDEDRRQQHQRAIQRRGHEHVLPGEALQDADDERREKGPEVDHPVVDAEAERGIGLVCRARDGAGDDGLEEAGPGRHHQQGEEHNPVGRGVARREVPGREERERHHEHPAVAVPVRQRAAQDRQHIRHGVDDALEEPDRLLRKAQSALGDGPREVDGQHGVHAVVGPPLEELHDVGDPERARELAAGRGLGHARLLLRGWRAAAEARFYRRR